MAIPPALLKLMNLDVGAQVALSVEHGKLVAAPAAPTRRCCSTAELLKGAVGVRKLNAQAAWARDGEPVGHEVA